MNQNGGVRQRALGVVAVLAVIFGAGVYVGYGQGSLSQARSLDIARSEVATCARELTDAQGVLDGVRDELRRQRREHDQRVADAERSVAGRDDEIAALKANAKVRIRLSKEELRHDDCRALADLPVCRPLADRLWSGNSHTP